MGSFKDAIAARSLKSAMKSDPAVYEAYRRSFKALPDLSSHYTSVDMSALFENKSRFLISSQAAFVVKQINELLESQEGCDLLDVGDSDGSLQLMIKNMIGDKNNVSTTGLNLQTKAVKKIRAKGLEALNIDVMDLAKQAKSYDIVTVLETIEHLPDPIGFLESIHPVVRKELIVSVPFVRQSRVSLRYLDSPEKGQDATIENVHIFELSPDDWRKIFLHSGWRLKRQTIARQYGMSSVWRLTAPIWRRLDFEGFWLASFTKDSEARQAYSIEGK